MGKRQLPPEEPAEIHEGMLRDALEERYLDHALSTIMNRALPDARDGLKPVHRRILYGMRLLRLDPGAALKKPPQVGGAGVRPGPRRILYGRRLLRLDPGAAFKKSAKVVGDVMGNFHPHGDQAIYDALVRLAQDFAQRSPLGRKSGAG